MAEVVVIIGSTYKDVMLIFFQQIETFLESKKLGISNKHASQQIQRIRTQMKHTIIKNVHAKFDTWYNNIKTIYSIYKNISHSLIAM